MTSLQEEIPILREAVTSLREEVRTELQSFYERISTLIERSSAYPVAAPAPAPVPALAPAPAFGPPPPPPPPSHSGGTQAEKKADATITGPSDDIAHTAVDTPALAADPPINIVYFF